MNPQIWWYLARASGIVAWAVLTFTLIWGVMLSTKWMPANVRPPWVMDLHRWLGGLSLTLVGVHLAALVADSYLPFGPLELFVPFTSQYRPFAVGVGVLGLYLLVLVQVSSLAMRRIPNSWWRVLHMTSYGLVFVVSLHAALAGTDALRGFYLVATIALTVAPVIAITVRLARPRPKPKPRSGDPARPAAPVAAP